MRSLYQISSEYRMALNDELIDDELATFDQIERLNTLEDDFETKAINIASYIKNLEAESDLVKSAIKGMQERTRKIDIKIEDLSNYLRMSMNGCGIKEIRKSPNFVIKVKTNPSSVVIDNEKLIADEYKKVKEIVSIDKLAIKNDIENGVIVKGARIEQKTRLEIK